MVTRAQIQAARGADLYEYLCMAHSDEVKQEGHWLRLKANPSICTKKGFGGYKDYATLESGNSIDFLVRYMKYDFVTAVTRLTEMQTASGRSPSQIHDLVFPCRSDNSEAIRTYLTGRGFTEQVMNRLMAENLLYQDMHRNAVFRSMDDDFFELRGTWPGKVYHQCGKSFPDRFWYFLPVGTPVQAMICESAIDAVSLFLLHQEAGKADGNIYCGIAGVANQQAIDRVFRRFPAVLAVDNDEAGQECRRRNSHLPALIPQNKDWNEDLMMTRRI